jgi:hypothetical protein
LPKRNRKSGTGCGLGEGELDSGTVGWHAGKSADYSNLSFGSEFV